MRILEMVMLVISIFLPLLVSSNKEQSIKKIVGILSIGVLLGHLVLEGGRWQMLSIYGINIILIICCLKGYSYFKGNWFRKIINGLFLFFLIGLGFFFSTVLPVFDFPTPTGDYQIGSQLPTTEMARFPSGPMKRYFN